MQTVILNVEQTALSNVEEMTKQKLVVTQGKERHHSNGALS